MSTPDVSDDPFESRHRAHVGRLRAVDNVAPVDGTDQDGDVARVNREHDFDEVATGGNPQGARLVAAEVARRARGRRVR